LKEEEASQPLISGEKERARRDRVRKGTRKAHIPDSVAAIMASMTVLTDQYPRNEIKREVRTG